MKHFKTLLKFAALPALIFLGWLLLLEISFFKTSDSLYAQNIKTLDGETYDIKKGRIYKGGKEINRLTHPFTTKEILKLGNFYQITLEDPLFFGGQIEETKWVESLKPLKEYHDQLKDALKIKENIFAIDFFESLPELSKKQGEFLKRPDSENANDLIKAYKDSVTLYENEAKNLKKNIETVFPLSKNQVFETLASRTDNATILADLELVIKNADAIKKDIQKRENILKGKAIYERRESETALSPFENKIEKTDMLPREDLYVGDFTGRLSGPYEAETSCFSGKKENEIFYVFYPKNRITEETVFLPKLATDNYYQLLSKSNETEESFINAGYTWRPTYEGNTYKCNDLGYQAELLNLDTFLKKYKNGLFSEIINTNEFESLKNDEKSVVLEGEKVEKLIFEGEIPVSSDLNALSSFYFSSYKFFIDFPEIKKRFLERYYFIENKLDNFELILNTNFFYDNLVERSNKKMLISGSQNYLYASRSNYSIAFLEFNKFSWRMSKNLKLNNTESAMKFLPEDHFVSYKELLKRGFSKQKIFSWNFISEEDVLF